MSLASAIDMAMFYPAGLIQDRFGRKFASVPSFAIMAAGLALIPLTGDFLGFLAAACLSGFGNGIGSGTMMTLGADLAPRGATGPFLGLWHLIGDIGSTGGPVAGGRYGRYRRPELIRSGPSARRHRLRRYAPVPGARDSGPPPRPPPSRPASPPLRRAEPRLG